MRVVLCNCPVDQASRIARDVVEAGLAACVSILAGVQSVYRWNGQLMTDEESTLVIKVAKSGVDDLRERLVAIHPYDLPEVVVLSVETGESHGPYVSWVRAASEGER